MSETLLRDGDLLVRSDGALRRITLNRPQALNAITLDMALAMTALLREWWRTCILRRRGHPRALRRRQDG